MFYHACLADGCSKKFARMLYIGVRIGTLVSKDEFLEESVSIESEFIDTRSISPEDSEIVSNFWKLVDLQTAPTEDRISDLGLETFDSESGGETAESEIDFDNLDSEIERLFS
jgi:hypothetical protein